MIPCKLESVTSNVPGFVHPSALEQRPCKVEGVERRLVWRVPSSRARASASSIQDRPVDVPLHRRNHAQVVGHDSGKRSTPGVSRRGRESFVIETSRLGVVPISPAQIPSRINGQIGGISHPVRATSRLSRSPAPSRCPDRPACRQTWPRCEHLGPTYRPLAMTGGKCRVYPTRPLSWMAPIPPEGPGSTDEVELSIRASNVLRPRERFTEVVLLEEKAGVLDAGTGCRLNA